MTTGPQGKLGTLARQSAVYAVGNATVKFAGLVLAPLLLNPAYLSVASYGYFAVLMVTAQLGVYAVGLGIGTGLLKYLSGESDGLDRAALPFTALIASVATAIGAGTVAYLLASPAAFVLLDDPAASAAVLHIAWYVGFKVIGSVPLTVLRVKERPVVYAVAVVLEVVVLIGFVYWQLAVLDAGLEGLTAAYAASAGVGALVLTAAMLARVRWRFSSQAVMPLLRYGVPLVLAGLAGWFLNAGDRYLLKWLADPRQLAGYDWAARLAGIINMLFVQSFQLAFSVFGLKALRVGSVDVYRRTFRHYVIWTGWAVLALSLLAPDGMRLLTTWFDIDPWYVTSTRLVFPLALGFMAYGLYIVLNNILLAEGATLLIGGNVLVAALVNAAMNIALIPKWGAMGAAVSTVAAYALLAAIAGFAAGRRLRVNYPWSTGAIVLMLLTGLYAAGLFVESFQPALRLALKGGLLVLYGSGLVVFGAVRFDEIRAVLMRLRGDSPV